MKSVITYFGGKGLISKKIIHHFPILYSIYIEAYGGGASILFSKPPTPLEIYNDIYENVYSLFKVLSNKILFKEFKELCDLSFFSRQLREEFADDLKRDDLTLVERAFRYWYTNRTSHTRGDTLAANTSVRRKMSKSVSDFLTSIDNLSAIHNRLSKVIIEKQDALKLLKKYDVSTTFAYLDPPYHHDTRTDKRYNHDLTNEQQEILVDYLLTSKSKILLSGYKNSEYTRLEEYGWKRIDFPVKISGGVDNKAGIKVESLWKNYGTKKHSFWKEI